MLFFSRAKLFLQAVKMISVVLLSAFLVFKPTLSFSAEDSQEPIKIGLLPYLSPAVLIQLYQPLVQHLQSELQAPILVSTAPNFKIFLQRVEQQQYDFYLTAPHFAALAEKQFQHRRLLRMARELNGSVVISKTSSVKNWHDLKGKVMATPDPLAIITMLGELSSKQAGLIVDKDITIKSTLSHNAALMEVFDERATAAVVSAAVFEKLPSHYKKSLMLFGSTDKVPHMMFMANDSVDEDNYLAYKEALLSFSSSAQGTEFFKKSGYGKLIEISDDDMDKLQELLPILNKRLDQKQTND